MAGSIKPTNFPIRALPLTGVEELYTQLGGINEKFTVNDVANYVLSLSSGATDTDWVETPTTVYNDTKNVGVGLNAPIANLDVSGDTRISSTLGFLGNIDDDTDYLGLGLGSFNGGAFLDDITDQLYLYGMFGSEGTQLITGIFDFNLSTNVTKFVGSGEGTELDGGFVLHCATNDVSDRSTLWVRETGFDLFYFTEIGNPSFGGARVSVDSTKMVVGLSDDEVVGTDVSTLTQGLVFTSGSVDVYLDGAIAFTVYNENGVVNIEPKIPSYGNDATADGDGDLKAGSMYTVTTSREIRIKP